MRTLDAAFQAASAGHLPRYGCEAECRKSFCLLPPDRMLSGYVPTHRLNDLPARLLTNVEGPWGPGIDFNRRKIESAGRIMIGGQRGIEFTKANSPRGSTFACTSGSVIAVLVLKRAR